MLHRRQRLLAKLGHRHQVVLAAGPRLPDRIERAVRMKLATVTPGIACGYWNTEEQAELRSLVGAQLRDLPAVEEAPRRRLS